MEFRSIVCFVLVTCSLLFFRWAWYEGDRYDRSSSSASLGRLVKASLPPHFDVRAT